jgi:hypothetical protein
VKLKRSDSRRGSSADHEKRLCCHRHCKWPVRTLPGCRDGWRVLRPCAQPRRTHSSSQLDHPSGDSSLVGEVRESPLPRRRSRKAGRAPRFEPAPPVQRVNRAFAQFRGLVCAMWRVILLLDFRSQSQLRRRQNIFPNLRRGNPCGWLGREVVREVLSARVLAIA